MIGDRGEMVGGAVAFGDVKSFDADVIRDGDRQDVDGRGGGGLGDFAALQEGGEAGIVFDGVDAAVAATLLVGQAGDGSDVAVAGPRRVSGGYGRAGAAGA